MLWATRGGCEHGFGVIETWVCVLAPLCAAVSSAVLTSWRGTYFTHAGKGTQHRSWHLRMEALFPSPSPFPWSSGYFMIFDQQALSHVLLHWRYFPMFRPPPHPDPSLHQTRLNNSCVSMWPNPGPQSWKTWHFLENVLLKNNKHIESISILLVKYLHTEHTVVTVPKTRQNIASSPEDLTEVPSSRYFPGIFSSKAQTRFAKF